MLTPENLATEENFVYPDTIEEDVSRMDDTQLYEYLTALFIGRYFRAYPSIAFLPESMRLDRDRNMAHRLARLYADSGEVNPPEDYMDPDFRTRLSSVLVSFLGAVTEGKDVLEQLGHTPEHPWMGANGEPIPDEYLDWRRREIIQGCIDIVSSILYKDGPMEASVNAIFDSIPEGDSISIDDFNDRAADEVEVSIKPEHIELLLLVRKLMDIPEFEGKITYGNIILGILSDLSDAEK